MRRLDIPSLRLCRIPQCVNELDSQTPTEGPQADMCGDCRKGESLAIRFYNEAIAHGRDPDAMSSTTARAQPRRVQSRPRAPATAVEMKVLRGIALGLTNAQIAASIWRSQETVKSHVRHLLSKFGAANRAHLVAIGYERGLLP